VAELRQRHPDRADVRRGERWLAADMVRYWGGSVRDGKPQAFASSPWPFYNGTRLTLSLRAGGQSVPVTDYEIFSEHSCDLWSPT
jgi:hypothetical protein